MAPIHGHLARAARARPGASPALSTPCLARATTTTTTTTAASTTRGAHAAALAALPKRYELPRVAQPSVWQNLLPKHFRSQRKRPFTWDEWRAKPWNPATAWIAFGLVIGSNAITTLSLRRDVADFSRRADAKIGLLREVLEKVQRGEDVDVERVLGTGQEESEREWEDALKEVEHEDRTWQSRKRRKASTTEAEATTETAPPTPPAAESTPVTDSKNESTRSDYVVPQGSRGAVGFY